MGRPLRKKQTFTALTLLLVLSRAADAATTYMVTPDLRHETNPVVSLFGADWVGVLVVQVVLTAGVVWLIYWDLFGLRPPHPDERGLSFSDFAGAYYFRRKSTPLDFVWRLSPDWQVSVKLCGYALPRILTALGLIVASSSILSLHSEVWRGVLRVASPWLFLVPAAGAAPFCIWGFLRREYSYYAGDG